MMRIPRIDGLPTAQTEVNELGRSCAKAHGQRVDGSVSVFLSQYGGVFVGVRCAERQQTDC